MPKFSYRARDKNGQEITGYKDANDRYELARFLRLDGAILLAAEDTSVKEKKIGGGMAALTDFLQRFGRIKLAERIIFSRNLGVMIGAGLSLTRALEALSRESHNPKFKAVIDDVINEVRQGKSFSESLAKHPRVFSTLYVSMVEAGEKSGKLQESLTVIANQLQADYDLVRKVKGAMVYPSVILVAMIFIGVGMMIYVVPTLSSVFKELNVELPSTTRFIIWMSELFLNYLFFFIIGAILLVGGLIQLARTAPGKRFLDVFFVKAPLVGGLTKKFNAARTARTLSSLISSGVQVLESLDITSRVVQNHLYGAVLLQAKQSIQRGDTISKIFIEHQDLYPTLVGEMLAVGEETGESSKMLDEVAKFYETQVSDATKDLSTIIEPVLMIIIGLAVGFFAVSMIMPMYSLTDAL